MRSLGLDAPLAPVIVPPLFGIDLTEGVTRINETYTTLRPRHVLTGRRRWFCASLGGSWIAEAYSVAVLVVAPRVQRSLPCEAIGFRFESCEVGLFCHCSLRRTCVLFEACVHTCTGTFNSFPNDVHAQAILVLRRTHVTSDLLYQA